MGLPVHVADLTKRHRGARTQALGGVTFDIPAGESLGLVGPNGAGKTTLLGCLLGHLRPDGGLVRVGALPPDDLAIRALTGYVPERPIVPRGARVRSFLEFHHALAGLFQSDRDGDVHGVLERVALDESLWDRPLRTLSRGLLQRVSLAQALLGRPRLMVLDEAASGLDPEGILLFIDLVNGLRAQGATVVLSSHQLDHVSRCCDRVLLIREGVIRSDVRAGECDIEALFRKG